MANRSPSSQGKVPGTRGGKVPLKGRRPVGGLQPGRTSPGGLLGGLSKAPRKSAPRRSY